MLCKYITAHLLDYETTSNPITKVRLLITLVQQITKSFTLRVIVVEFIDFTLVSGHAVDGVSDSDEAGSGSAHLDPFLTLSSVLPEIASAGRSSVEEGPTSDESRSRPAYLRPVTGRSGVFIDGTLIGCKAINGATDSNPHGTWTTDFRPVAKVT